MPLIALRPTFLRALALVVFTGIPCATAVEVEGQPLGANLVRVTKALEYLGAPWPESLTKAIEKAANERDADALQALVAPRVLADVHINPEHRVSAKRGEAPGQLQQGGYTPVLIRVINQATATRALTITSPQGGAVYAGASLGILERQAQTELNADENVDQATDRFLDVAMFQSSPMTDRLSGLMLEYTIALIHCSEAGKREATLVFDVGQGTQDLGFRSEMPVLFDSAPAVSVPLRIRDVDGSPTAARLTFRDRHGRVYPPQPKRLAPDLFFQPQIYRQDGDRVLLPPGDLTMTSSRGPEYIDQVTEVSITAESASEPIRVPLQRWIDPMKHGYYVGDHHIHGAGCSHYTSPTEGVLPEHMFVQVKGEALNVGCVLTWGPCYDYQRQFFSPKTHQLSEPLTIVKYDVEVSGFGSAAMGHVCLLNLSDQTYPGSQGRKDIGWPTWTVPVMRWCQEQGGVTGYPHSAIGSDAPDGARWLLDKHDQNEDGFLSIEEARAALLPDDFGVIDRDDNGLLPESELVQSLEQAANTLPNVAIPALDRGAMEIFVSVPEGVCDFISAMDTPRISEWNTWYHLMNCGFPLKLSGETDFPCMSSRRVGQGRVYVQLGKVEQLDYVAWCRGIASGQSYVSDGYAHAMDFKVKGVRAGQDAIQLDASGDVVTVTATVGFAPTLPEAVAYGTLTPAHGKKIVGDTIHLHAPRSDREVEKVEHTIEVVVNGTVVATQMIKGDGKLYPLSVDVPVTRSSWVALRSFPQMHTNPVTVLVGGEPIRASRDSARWCDEAVERLWAKRSKFISEEERPQAKAAYDRARARYQQILAECEG